MTASPTSCAPSPSRRSSPRRAAGRCCVRCTRPPAGGRQAAQTVSTPPRRAEPGRAEHARRGHPGDLGPGAPGHRSPARLRRGRAIVPIREWTHYLTLGVTEIREHGARSTQVARRLRAMLYALSTDVRPEHRRSIDAELSRLEVTVEGSFAGSVDVDLARESDVQGVGGPRPRRPGW